MLKVSVIVPSFNHKSYLVQCVDSVLSQTYRDLELIIVDDGSSDGSLEILRGYGAAITLITQESRGTQAARNTAIKASSGELIAILDSDDVWLPHKLEAQIEKFVHQPEIGLVYSFAHTVDSCGNRTNVNWHLGKRVDHPNGALAQLLLGCYIPALTAMFRTRCIDEVGLFDENLLGSGDWDLWLRIAARFPIACVEEPLALYRVHATNTTKMLFQTKTVRIEHEQVLRKAFQLPEVVSLPAEIRNQALARTSLSGAEAEAIRGNAKAIGKELRRAIELDPTILEDLNQLGNLLVHWAHIYAAGSPFENPYLCFVSEVFSQISPVTPSSRSLQRRVLSESVMGRVFSAHDAGDHKRVRELLMIGLFANPRWLRNRGVWSIMADAYLGRKITTGPRSAIKRLRAPSV